MAYLFYIFNKKNIFKKPVQKISSHFDEQKGKQKSALILLWKKINKNRSQNIIKASAFFNFKQTFFWYMSKMYLWVLTLVTLFEPTLAGQLSRSF